MAVVLVNVIHVLYRTLITTQNFLINHTGTIVSQEHGVGIDVRTDFQLDSVIALDGFQRSTVTTKIDGTLDNSRLRLCTPDTQGHLLGIRTEQVQGLSRLEALLLS